jgi:hypothetical protein
MNNEKRFYLLIVSGSVVKGSPFKPLPRSRSDIQHFYIGRSFELVRESACRARSRALVLTDDVSKEFLASLCAKLDGMVDHQFNRRTRVSFAHSAGSFKAHRCKDDLQSCTRLLEGSHDTEILNSDVFTQSSFLLR